MLLGNSKLNITPKEPIYLAGFAHRAERATKVEQKLYVKTFIIRKDNKKLLFIIADLIWWDDKFVKDLLVIIASKYSIPLEQVCFHATHNHSGPQTSLKFSKQLGELSKPYLLFLKERILTSIELATKDMVEVSMEIGTGISDVGVYRRKEVDGEIRMKPNTNIAIDNELTVISFHTVENKKKAIWLHYSCHPTTTDANILSSEFTGICCEEIERNYYGATAAFLQGFCGDVRPNLVKENQFYRGTIKDMVRTGNVFASDVMKVIQSSKKVSLEGSVICESKEIPLRFNDKDCSPLVPESLAVEWPKLVQSNLKEGYTLIFQYIRLSDKISFLTCNAELVQDYSFFLKNIEKNILPLGYSNGMIGYIPTKKQLNEGGYEAVDSIFYFGYPSIVATEMEKRIKKVLQKLLGGKENEDNK